MRNVHKPQRKYAAFDHSKCTLVSEDLQLKCPLKKLDDKLITGGKKLIRY